jgi:hypothetical protein
MNVIVFGRKTLPFQFIEQVYFCTLQIPVDHYDNCQAYADFCRCHGHNEKHENLAIRIGAVSRESGQKQVYSVEHQFDTHKHDDRISAKQDAGNANCKESRAQKKIIVQRNGPDDLRNFVHKQ